MKKNFIMPIYHHHHHHHHYLSSMVLSYTDCPVCLDIREIVVWLVSGNEIFLWRTQAVFRLQFPTAFFWGVKSLTPHLYLLHLLLRLRMCGDITPFIPISPFILIVYEPWDKYDVYLDEINRYCLHRFNFVL
jgi:hypothetical protein